jgi:hypothetical protein
MQLTAKGLLNMPTDTVSAFEDLKKAYSRYNYYDFIKILDLRDDYYAESKWVEFTKGVQTLFRLSNAQLLLLIESVKDSVTE